MNRSNAKRDVRVLAAAILLAFQWPAWAAAAAASYPTADAAAEALVQALKSGDKGALAHVFGANWHDYIPVEGVDRDDVDAFVDDYAQAHRIDDAKGVSHLSVGKEGWTLPIPLVHGASGWSFDTRAGHDEIVARQIGHNELSVIQALLACYDAQRDYATTDRNGDGAPEYAQKLLSTAGKHDGLYWASVKGEPESPLGPYFATPPDGDGYLGYHFRILTAQGPSAPGGAYDYMSGKRMINGFALVAWPVRYGETGVMTFMVSHDGQVFQKDLGPTSDKAATSIKRFDPDSSWTEVPASP